MAKRSYVQVVESKRRSFLKALTWRIWALLVTGTVVWALTGRLVFAVQVGLIDMIFKLLVYYFHERVWNRVSFGRIRIGEQPPEYEI